MIKRINLFCFSLLIISAGLVVPCEAKELHKVKFDPIIENDDKAMVLQGVGLKRVFFMKAFVAGFYLQQDVATENLFDDVSKRLEVAYFVDIPGVKLSKYTEDLMQKNTTKKEFKLLEGRVKIMRQYFVDLQPGDRFALTYIPDLGTKFEYNGTLMGIIEGEDFADGLFATWVGEKPMDHKLKKQILG